MSDGRIKKTFIKVSRARGKDGVGERWERMCVSPTLALFDLTGESRVCAIVVSESKRKESV